MFNKSHINQKTVLDSPLSSESGCMGISSTIQSSSGLKNLNQTSQLSSIENFSKPDLKMYKIKTNSDKLNKTKEKLKMVEKHGHYTTNQNLKMDSAKFDTKKLIKKSVECVK